MDSLIVAYPYWLEFAILFFRAYDNFFSRARKTFFALLKKNFHYGEKILSHYTLTVQSNEYFCTCA